MTYLILIIVSLALLGSWLMVRPSPYERRSAGLRKIALAEGFKVRIAMSTRDSDAPLPRHSAEYWKSWEGGEVFAMDDIQVPASAPEFPEDHVLRAVSEVAGSVRAFLRDSAVEIVSLNMRPGSLGFVWLEDAGSEDLKKTLSSFDNLQRLIVQELKKIP